MLYTFTTAALVKLSSNEGMLQNSSSLPSTTCVPVKCAMAEHGTPPLAQLSLGGTTEDPPSDVEQLARQRPPEQQPLAQPPPVQQMSPRPPQRAQMPFVAALHTSPAVH